jgi:hypothetical protein
MELIVENELPASGRRDWYQIRLVRSRPGGCPSRSNKFNMQPKITGSFVKLKIASSKAFASEIGCCCHTGITSSKSPPSTIKCLLSSSRNIIDLGKGNISNETNIVCFLKQAQLSACTSAKKLSTCIDIVAETSGAVRLNKSDNVWISGEEANEDIRIELRIKKRCDSVCMSRTSSPRPTDHLPGRHAVPEKWDHCPSGETSCPPLAPTYGNTDIDAVRNDPDTRKHPGTV